ncbi:hypothetical protein [Nocardia sp. NPDC059239]|uniref:hypothetical protein n=1 Tax=unclassified Nocardia TaxID=2637762 RepID=UPI0036889B14
MSDNESARAQQPQRRVSRPLAGGFTTVLAAAIAALSLAAPVAATPVAPEEATEASFYFPDCRRRSLPPPRGWRASCPHSPAARYRSCP